jgi:CHAD domain-containing protein
MSYEMSFAEAPADSVRRLGREQLDAAAERLERGHDDDPVEAVHDVRKRLKKSRALLRLARPGMKAKAFRRHNRELRDTGRALSGARDADVMLETVDALAKRFAGHVPHALFDAIRAPLAARARDSRAKTEPAISGHTDTLRELAGRRWAVDDLTSDALSKALRQTYERGRDAFARADRKPTVEHLHEWRKRVKDLWYHERLLANSWPGVMKAQAEEAKTLSKLLGEDHDLAVLSSLLRNDPELTGAPAADLDTLLELIAQRRAELLERSRVLGKRIYAERPKAFARRAGRYVDLAAA